jgi:hypothetical protein
MENKQTAVNFLIEQIIDKQPAGFYVIDSQEECYNLFEKARQMEKEQIIEAFKDGCDVKYKTASDQYYKTVYGK